MELQVDAADPKAFALQALDQMAADEAAGPANESYFPRAASY